MKLRQEVLNIHLAHLLNELGLRVWAERVQSRKAPDLIIHHPLLGIILGEAEVGKHVSDETAREKLSKRAYERLTDPVFNFINSVLLIIYPKELVERASSCTESEIPRILRESLIGLGLAYKAMTSALPDVKIKWQQAYPTQIPNFLEVSAQDIVKEMTGRDITPKTVIGNAINLIEHVSNYARNLAEKKEWQKWWEKFAESIGIDLSVLKNKSDGMYLAAKTLYILAAMSIIIYEITRTRYPDTLKVIERPLSFQKLAQALQDLSKINYMEIVEIAQDVFAKMPGESVLEQYLDELCDLILKNISLIMRWGWETLASLYQMLLSETYRKAYATFYTKMPAALLLALLATESPYEKVIDPAEGTGSLLIASFYARQWLALRPRNIEEMLGDKCDKPILDEVAVRILNSTFGMDALRMAVAISCGSMTIASLAVPHNRLKLYHVEVGSSRSGSLDLLIPYKLQLMPKEIVENIGGFDLVIMNPPFTRSDRIPNLIGKTAREELKSARLTFGGVSLSDIFVAGLAKPFLALADKLVKENGRIAAVLPNSVLSRPAWADVREGIGKVYTVEYIVISWAPGTPNFSSDTEFREILLVLSEGRHDDRPVKIVYLLEPIDELDATDVYAVANAAKSLSVGEVEYISVVRRKKDKDVVLAKVFCFSQSVVDKFRDNLYRLVAFYNPELTKWHISLVEKFNINLGSLFRIGSIVDHSTGLRVIDGVVKDAYPAVWGSGCDIVRGPRIREPTHSVVVESLSKVKVKFWKNINEYSSYLFMLRRGRITTQCALSFVIDSEQQAISNVWWPLYLQDDSIRGAVPAYLVFFNSTLGFTYLLGERLETEGLFIEYKKDMLCSLRVPDFTKLPNNLVARCSEVLSNVMPRFDEYISKMSVIESRTGNWASAIEYVLKHEQSLASRAILDKLALEILQHVYPDIGYPPRRFYELLHREIEVLRNIMEKNRNTENHTIEDTGQVNTKKAKHTPLDKWIKGM